MSKGSAKMAPCTGGAEKLLVFGTVVLADIAEATDNFFAIKCDVRHQ